MLKRSILLSLATLLALAGCGESANRTPTGLSPESRGGLNPKGPSLAVSGNEGAIIATDKDDYAPGEVVTITGSGWAAGETVHLTLSEDPVKDGVHEWDVVADSAGNFTDRSFTPGKQHLSVTFTLVATGPLSGVSTQLTFTDGSIAATASAAGTSVQATKIEYSSAGCASGAGSPSTVTLSTDTLTLGGLGINQQQNKSVRLTIVSVAGGTFDSWSVLDLQKGSSNISGTIVCITATDNGVSGKVVANVTATQTAASTSTSLGSLTNPSSYGQSVTFTATVSRTSGSGTLTGNVQFRIDEIDVEPAVALSNTGQATLSTSTLSAGTHSIGATYLGVDMKFEPSSGVLTGGQVVEKAAQTITFDPLENMTYGDASFSLSAVASSKLTVAFSVAPSAVCTLSGNTVTLNGAGTCTVTASQPGGNNYSEATNVVRSFIVAKARSTVNVTWAGGTYTGKAFEALGSVSGIGSPAEIVVSPEVTLTYYSGGAPSGTALSGPPTNAGTYTVHASFAGNTNYNSSSADKTITIDKAQPTVEATGGGPFTYDGSPHGGTGVATGVAGPTEILSPAVTLSYAGTGLTVYAANANAPVNAGTYAVTASFEGNGNYLSGTSVPAAFTIEKAPQAITFTSSPPNPAVLGSTYTPGATGGGSGNAVVFGTSGGCTYSSATSVVTFTSVISQCTVTANQAGNNNYKDAPQETQQFGIIFKWAGFFQPVDNGGVFNSVKAGSSIPVKFSLGGNQGLNILAAISPSSRPISCNSSAPSDPIEETATAGSSSLSYDASVAPFGQYVYVWKTDKGWAGTCRQLTVTLVDGTSHPAVFQFSK